MTNSVVVLQQSYSKVIEYLIWTLHNLNEPTALLRCRKTTKLCKHDDHKQHSRFCRYFTTKLSYWLCIA